MPLIEIRQQAASLPALIDGAAARLTAARTSAEVLEAKHEHVCAYERLGWMWAADLGDYHGQFSCLMSWLCTCPLVEPDAQKTEIDNVEDDARVRKLSPHKQKHAPRVCRNQSG